MAERSVGRAYAEASRIHGVVSRGTEAAARETQRHMRALVTNGQLSAIAEGQAHELSALHAHLAKARAAAFPMLVPHGWASEAEVRPPSSPKPMAGRPSARARMSPCK
eukprot:364833-Chlamydomonas_euryale.AAC.1